MRVKSIKRILLLMMAICQRVITNHGEGCDAQRKVNRLGGIYRLVRVERRVGHYFKKETKSEEYYYLCGNNCGCDRYDFWNYVRCTNVF